MGHWGVAVMQWLFWSAPAPTEYSSVSIWIGTPSRRRHSNWQATRSVSASGRAPFRTLKRLCTSWNSNTWMPSSLDLGLSSHQIDTPGRGFRFGGEDASETPLDMRMDQDLDRNAAELLRTASRNELEQWFRDYGELRGARRLARQIESTRRQKPFETAADLIHAVKESRIGGGRRHNPATLVFQALRIAVNDELAVLRRGLESAVSILRPGGRIVVMAYHSLEDRIVKTHFRDAARSCSCPPQVPICICGGQATLQLLTPPPITSIGRRDPTKPASALRKVACRRAFGGSRGMNRPSLRASANSSIKRVGTRMQNRAFGQPNPIHVIGRDMARERQRTGIPTRLTVLLMVLTALAGLGIVGMRSDVMRIRYALSAAMAGRKAPAT